MDVITDDLHYEMISVHGLELYWGKLCYYRSAATCYTLYARIIKYLQLQQWGQPRTGVKILRRSSKIWENLAQVPKICAGPKLFCQFFCQGGTLYFFWKKNKYCFFAKLTLE